MLFNIINFLGIKRLLSNLLFNLHFSDRDTLGCVYVFYRLLVLIRMNLTVLDNWSLFLFTLDFFKMLDRSFYLQRLHLFFYLLLLEPNQCYTAHRRLKAFADIFSRLQKYRVDLSYVCFSLLDVSLGQVYSLLDRRFVLAWS